MKPLAAPPFTAFVGIDWADTKHDICLQAGIDAPREFACIPHKVPDIHQWAQSLHQRFGGPIAVARRAGHNFTYAQLMFWYTINDMIVPGSTYWNVAFGTKKGQVSEDTEGMETMARFAENLAWLAKKISA